MHRERTIVKVSILIKVHCASCVVLLCIFFFENRIDQSSLLIQYRSVNFIYLNQGYRIFFKFTTFITFLLLLYSVYSILINFNHFIKVKHRIVNKHVEMQLPKYNYSKCYDMLNRLNGVVNNIN